MFEFENHCFGFSLKSLQMTVTLILFLSPWKQSPSLKRELHWGKQKGERSPIAAITGRSTESEKKYGNKLCCWWFVSHKSPWFVSQRTDMLMRHNWILQHSHFRYSFAANDYPSYNNMTYTQDTYWSSSAYFAPYIYILCDQIMFLSTSKRPFQLGFCSTDKEDWVN